MTTPTPSTVPVPPHALDQADPPSDLDHRAVRYGLIAVIYRDAEDRTIVEVDTAMSDVAPEDLIILLDGHELTLPEQVKAGES